MRRMQRPFTYTETRSVSPRPYDPIRASIHIQLAIVAATAACNGAVYGVGSAVSNGDTQGADTVQRLISSNNNFLSVKGGPSQTVLGPCEGAPGQCPTQ